MTGETFFITCTPFIQKVSNYLPSHGPTHVNFMAPLQVFTKLPSFFVDKGVDFFPKNDLKNYHDQIDYVCQAQNEVKQGYVPPPVGFWIKTHNVHITISPNHLTQCESVSLLYFRVNHHNVRLNVPVYHVWNKAVPRISLWEIDLTFPLLKTLSYASYCKHFKACIWQSLPVTTKKWIKNGNICCQHSGAQNTVF